MKLWGGRFQRETAGIMDEFNASISFDQRLYRQDIIGSIAHAKMLGRTGIIDQEESRRLVDGLRGILEAIEEGRVEFSIEQEDIHMNIEKLLVDRIGEVGKKLHTARSRNDQVALDLRLYLRDGIQEIIQSLLQLMAALVDLAQEHVGTLMPGYTHLQRAQPINLGFHLMAYFQMFKRDLDRLRECKKRMNQLPLGAGALAGTTYPTDREYLARELGFDGICENALDAVSDRDFVIEFLSHASMIMMHLSRFCEELILWSSAEFGFVEMDDAYSTGSSIMPQKKNPDVAELIRGKTGRVYGNLLNLLTLMKSLPLAYNKDMQEDKPPLFDTLDTLKNSLTIFRDMIATMRVRKDRMKDATKEGFMNATDVADYLVKKGVPFRSAHEVVGRMVLYCIRHGKSIEDLSLEEFQDFSAVFGEDILDTVPMENCMNSKISQGSTSTENVKIMVENARKYLDQQG